MPCRSPRKNSARRAQPAFRTAFEVHWQDWRRHHDWNGRERARPGASKPFRPEPPKRQSMAFADRAAAENFVAALRRDIPRDELVVQILDPQTPPAPAPVNQRFPGADGWPIQHKP